MNIRKLTLGLTAAALLSVFANGCAYRTDLAQGNFVEQDAVDQLYYGMSGAQARFILGTPMLVDPFDNSRWYYVHYLRKGWSEPEVKNLVLLFSGGALVDVSGDFKKPAGFSQGAPALPASAEPADGTAKEDNTAAMPEYNN
ncbi:MAG TPA: outer membrane protein assembly factor BamE [Succinivibrionaceae bacterium]|nr:outer membrane protein assembly factor BamE [Succinivibrionaceae bacterium]